MDCSRRDVLKIVSAHCLSSWATAPAQAAQGLLGRRPGWVTGKMTGADALIETLIQEGADCVFGIPGAQQNELWDAMKSKRLPYLLVTHEFSAAAMADGCARSTGKPGVLCIVPGPGLTNSLSGLGEALLDSIPLVCVVGDVANGRRNHAFQVHSLDQAALLRPVTKQVFAVQNAREIPQAVRSAFRLARAGEPGPVGVVVPYNLLIDVQRYSSGPLEAAPLPFDPQACDRALRQLAERRCRVGIYAGLGCMDYSGSLVRAAEILQSPVATSMAGKGAMPENHPLAVGWGYGPQGTRTAESAFREVDLVLALGVKFSEVSTGFYSLPRHRQLLHVDINADNIGRIMPTTVGVHSDVGVFLGQLLQDAPRFCRPEDRGLHERIRARKRDEARANSAVVTDGCVDPLAFLLALRRTTALDALAFVDVTLSQYWATETFFVNQPRTYFNPTNNQGMGWSVPAALGAQRVYPGCQVVTVTGDGCFLMSMAEISTAARECLPVKFFVLDDQAYQYMQQLQRPAYLRTTATILARLGYQDLARGFGIAYQEITHNGQLDERLPAILAHDGPVLTRVAVDYGRRPVRWLNAAKSRYMQMLTPEQKVRFLARIGSRALDMRPFND
ncbi:MAG: thiamine pyrophosphate-binding protein [Gemmataceae bacterium]|nr:thiamine pyrophosphate-binding protein [Gemmataceae bacterium]